jgi:hypothetical protein
VLDRRQSANHNRPTDSSLKPLSSRIRQLNEPLSSDLWLFIMRIDHLPTTHVHRGLNLSLAMIQEDYGAYVAASLGQELLSGRFSHEPVSRVVRVHVKSGHSAVWSNVVDVGTLEGGCARARRVELS